MPALIQGGSQMRDARSAVSGKFVSNEDAEANPRETTREERAVKDRLSEPHLMELSNVFAAAVFCLRRFGFRETIRRLTAES